MAGCGAGLQPSSPWAMRGRCTTHLSQSLVNGAQTPTQKWAFPTSDYLETQVTIAADGTVYLSAAYGAVYGLDPNGTLKWAFATGGSVYSSPAVGADGTVYVGSDDGKLYAFGP